MAGQGVRCQQDPVTEMISAIRIAAVQQAITGKWPG